MPRPLSSLLLIFSGLALFVWMLPERISGQAGQAIVIEGGTLIDGNVGAPVPDVQIVIRGNKIASVGKKGAAIPAGAQVVNADGKFILPGLMYVQAGGHVLAGTDGGQNAVPGPDLHHEAEILAEEGGFTPMQVIQSMTKWPAETMRVQDQIGTIEAGKFADVLIVNANPLQNISTLKEIAWVISNGTLRDTKFHSWYRPPFTGDGPVNIPPVDQLGYVANLKRAVFRGGQIFAGAPGGGRLPIPGIETFDTNRHDHPDPYLAKVMVTEGSPTINLTLNGFNFFDRAQVMFDNVPVPFRVVSPTEMVVTIDESLLRRAGRFPIVVKNLGPSANPEWGDGTSNKAWLLVNFKY